MEFSVCNIKKKILPDQPLLFTAYLLLLLGWFITPSPFSIPFRIRVGGPMQQKDASGPLYLAQFVRKSFSILRALSFLDLTLCILYVRNRQKFNNWIYSKQTAMSTSSNPSIVIEYCSQVSKIELLATRNIAR